MSRPAQPDRTLDEVEFALLDGDVLLVTINRPAKRNALTTAMLAAIASGVDDGGLRGVVVTGVEDVFSSGVDLAEAGELVAKAGPGRLIDLVRSALRAVTTAPVPVVAAVNGVALAGGLELALACDWVVASERALLSDHHASVDLVPGGGAMSLLAWRSGWATAQELVVSGRRLSAAEAHALGLVDEVASGERLLSASVAAVQRLARHPPAVQFTKRLKAAAVWDGELAQAERAAAADALGAARLEPPAPAT